MCVCVCAHVLAKCAVGACATGGGVDLMLVDMVMETRAPNTGAGVIVPARVTLTRDIPYWQWQLLGSLTHLTYKLLTSHPTERTLAQRSREANEATEKLQWWDTVRISCTI